MKKINIAIDGFSGTGKSSTARQVARILKYIYVDSGAMYRATTYYMLRSGVDLAIEAQVENNLKHVSISFDENKVFLNSHDVTDSIRSMEVNSHVSLISSYKCVRQKMVDLQRKIGTAKGVVMDGRDIGTVVFPDADLKVFMTANLDVRAARRQQELKEKGFEEELSVIKDNLSKRDLADSSRKESPLIKAESAVELDTSYVTFEQQVEKIVALAKSIIDEG